MTRRSLIVAVLVASSCAQPGSVADTQLLLETTTRAPETTLVAARDVVPDPRLGRPAYDDFYFLAAVDAEVTAFCANRNLPSPVDCYDAMARSRSDFVEYVRLKRREASAALVGGTRSGQHGCHSDGRCLDDYDTWCDEEEVIVDGLNDVLICESTYDRLSHP